ncbi:hypothetical protein [Brevundimonas lutea]|uniref:hypothetical protein n=1 Tax=Brevundimonas lutea TaxID=2293980 RepID=UPI000F021989|nr:hypothetical protein [Brevundimonas lutea]
MILELIAALTLIQAPQNDDTAGGRAPEAQPEPAEQVEEQPRRVCRYERTIGSSMQRRVCTNEPRPRRNISNMHSTWEAQSAVRRMQGSRIPDGQ